MVIIYGVGRNGSTLLPFLFDGSPDLYVYPIEFNFLSCFSCAKRNGKIKSAVLKLPSIYPELDCDGEVELALLKPFLDQQYLQLNAVIEESLASNLRFESDEFLKAYETQFSSISAKEFIDLYFEFYRKKLDLLEDKRRICIKTIEVGAIDQWNTLYPDHFGLHLIRDPLDNYSSLKRTHLIRKQVPNSFLGGDDLVVFLEQRWLMHLQWINQMSTLDKGRNKVLHYENLVEDPENVVTSCLKFFGVRLPDDLNLQTIFDGIKTMPKIGGRSIKTDAQYTKVVKFKNVSIIDALEKFLIQIKTNAYPEFLQNHTFNLGDTLKGMARFFVPSKYEWQNHVGPRSAIKFIINRRKYALRVFRSLLRLHILSFIGRKKAKKSFLKNVEKIRLELPSYISTRSNSSENRGICCIHAEKATFYYTILWCKVYASLGYEIYLLDFGNTPIQNEVFKRLGIKIVSWKEIVVHQKQKKTVFSTLPKNYIKETRHNCFIGINAMATVMRNTCKSMEMLDPVYRENLILNALNESANFADSAMEYLADVKPNLIVFNDRVYSPVAELFQYALNQGIKCVTYNASQQSGYLILKKYSSTFEIYSHPHSLSPESWEILKKQDFVEDDWTDLDSYVKRLYTSGDWFAEVGTQFEKSRNTKTEIIADLGLDPDKKTAVVFSHIFWDGTLSYGIDLYKNYFDWFVSVAKIAKENNNLNWVFKLHPANLVKASRENRVYDNQEMQALESVLGEFPEHIKVIPADSRLLTYDLFDLMDYCLTVRGTIGFESAAYGVRTLTAGTGRYDGLGFTMDFSSVDHYERVLSHLEDVPCMNSEEVLLARKFLNGLLVKRHLKLEGLSVEVLHDNCATHIFRFDDMEDSQFKQTKMMNAIRELLEGSNSDTLEVS